MSPVNDYGYYRASFGTVEVVKMERTMREQVYGTGLSGSCSGVLG